MNTLLELFKKTWSNSESGTYILFIMMIVSVASVYEFAVYRIVSHRSMYNKSFHISITIIPYFISAIIYALQSNILITLGTIGALAIIRYRTAVKDPVDMLYILWSIFIGISCGCRLFKLCFVTSIFVTIVLLAINLISGHFLFNPIILVINAEKEIEESIENILKPNAKKFRQKSRSYTRNSYIDYVYQIEACNKKEIIKGLDNLEDICNYSILEYDNEDVI